MWIDDGGDETQINVAIKCIAKAVVAQCICLGHDPAAPGSIPRNSIFTFEFIFELWWEKDKNKQKRAWIGPFQKIKKHLKEYIQMYQKELLRIKLNLTYKEVMGETQRKERLKDNVVCKIGNYVWDEHLNYLKQS